MKNKKLIIGLNLILFLGYFIYSVLDKEKILKDGNMILLKLAPVDPRSLVQGDYMRLNYGMNSELRGVKQGKGNIVLTLNSDRIGVFNRVQKEDTPINEGELLVKYRKVKWNFVKIGAESYFFEEGKAERFESAAYGCLRIDNKGNSVLVGLYSEDVPS